MLKVTENVLIFQVGYNVFSNYMLNNFPNNTC